MTAVLTAAGVVGVTGLLIGILLVIAGEKFKVEVDENPELARQFRVMSIPTLAVFKDGEMVKREVGAKSKAEILEMLG